MIYRKELQNQFNFYQLLLLTSISIAIACVVDSVSGRINHNSRVRSNSVVILPRTDYPEASFQGIKESSLSFTRKDSSAEEQGPRPVFNMIFASTSDNSKALGSSMKPMNQGYIILPGEAKNNSKNYTALYNVLNKVSDRQDYLLSTAPQYDREVVISDNQWVHSATTTSRPAYDQIPRPMLHVDGDTEDDLMDESDLLESSII